ncbi:hypothetical protein OFM39_35330, partial [Escherichia coli]|nr:hypothetical protein [Escherichia coli]
FITGNTLKYFSLKFNLLMRRKLNGKEKIIAAVKRMINGASEICLKSFPILNSVGYELKYSAVKNAVQTKRIIRKLIRISF